MGVVVREMTIDTTMAVESVMANSRKRRPTMPAIRRIGMKTAIKDMLMEKDGKADLPRPFKCGLHRGQAFFTKAGDVLHDDNRVVDDEARRIVSAISERLSMLKPNST